ncbi:MAG: glycosyltransferase [Planctomycetes bacterium]|nr:glycosyltransferase [Planctomycetota bacterium]
MRPLRVLRVLMVVEKLYGLGGAQAQALRLARALRSEGVEARIVTGRWRLREPWRAEVEGVPVTAVFTAFKMLHLKGLRKLGMYVYLSSLLLHLWLRRRSYDVLHVHSATSSAFAVALAGRWFGKPTVMKVMASGGWSDFKRMRRGGEVPGSAWMARRLRSVSRVICLNAEAEAECRAEGFAPEQCVSIPNGFPVGEVAPRAEQRRGADLLLLFAGRLDAQKDPAALLEAVAIAAASPGGAGVRARFLGDGPARRDLERRARELGVEGRVEILGRVDDVPAHLREADAFVLPSRSEGISNALLEAMAHGLPCVATRIPGNVDLVRDRETGLLVSPGDPRDLARAILELAQDPGLRERLGRAGRALVEARFDMRAVAHRYAELYRGLLEPASVAATA